MPNEGFYHCGAALGDDGPGPCGAGRELCPGEERGPKKRNELQLGGMALGMLLGVALGTTGLLENHALGISLGALWGLVIGTAVEPRDK